MNKTGTMREVSFGTIAVFSLVFGLTACGDDADGGLHCGEGTIEEDGECVAEATDAGADSGKRGPDEKDSGMKPADKDSGPAPVTRTCGAGTIESMGSCIPDPDKKLECGPGTFAKDGKCEVSPPPPPTIDTLRVTQLSIRNHGSLIEDNGEIQQYYPIDVSVGVTYKGDKATVPVVIALGEPPDPNKPADQQTDLKFCLVGGFDIKHPGGANATESISNQTLYIPKGCLGSESERKVSPIVLVDPDRTIGAKDQNAVTRRVAFMKQNNKDPDMAECRIDTAAGGAKGKCQIEVKVKPSTGIDFELAELTAESSVVVLDKCPSNADPDRPASYKCNSSIVPEFKIKRDGDGKPILDGQGNTQIELDGDGEPTQATWNDNGTDKPKWVYGAADLALDLTVMTYGEDDSQIANADDAMKLGAGDDEKAVHNVLEDHGLQIKYTIKPADADDDSWKPLYLHKQGEQAKAGEEGESGQDQENFEETQAVPATPSYYSHGLYVENDCGERNTATCNSSLTPRTDIIDGAWADKTNFIVRACLVPVDDTGATDNGFDDNNDNNCKNLPIKIVRRETSSSTSTASSYGFNYQWGDGVGSQSTLRLSWGFHTWNKLDTAGITIDNEGALTIGSDLVGYTDILKGWAKGAAYVSIVGSYYDYGISTFGIKLWGDSKVVPEFHWEKDWNVSKELRKGTIVWAGPVPINLEIRFAGSAGVTVNIDIVAVDAPFTDDEESETFVKMKSTACTVAGAQGCSSRVGLGQLTVTPYGNMTVTASASLSALVVRAGVAGELTLLNLKVPATGRLWWGLTNLSPVTLKLGVWADLKIQLTAMAGRIYLFAENYTVNWCSRNVDFGWWDSTVWYPCGSSWNRFWDFTIASWNGWTWNQTLWTSPYKEATIP